MSYAEYVAREAAADVKHEFIRGEVFAMSGARSITTELTLPLLGKRCRFFASDLRSIGRIV